MEMRAVLAQVESCCAYGKSKQNKHHLHGTIPYMFDCVAGPVVQLLLLGKELHGVAIKRERKRPPPPHSLSWFWSSQLLSSGKATTGRLPPPPEVCLLFGFESVTRTADSSPITHPLSPLSVNSPSLCHLTLSLSSHSLSAISPSLCHLTLALSSHPRSAISPFLCHLTLSLSSHPLSVALSRPLWRPVCTHGNRLYTNRLYCIVKCGDDPSVYYGLDLCCCIISVSSAVQSRPPRKLFKVCYDISLLGMNKIIF